MKQIILSMMLLLNCSINFAMQFDDEDSSPFGYHEPAQKTDDFRNLKFTHKSKSRDLTHGGNALGLSPKCIITKITAHTSENKEVGFIKIDGDDPCTFLRLHVYQFAKGNGIGKKLLEQAVAWSKSHGCKQVGGIIYSSMIGYYEQLGATCNPPLYDHDYLTTCRYKIPEDKV